MCRVFKHAQSLLRYLAEDAEEEAREHEVVDKGGDALPDDRHLVGAVFVGVLRV